MVALGCPVSNVLPDPPVTKIQSTPESLTPSMTNFAGRPPLGKISGQNGTDDHCGIINVLSTLYLLNAGWNTFLQYHKLLLAK